MRPAQAPTTSSRRGVPRGRSSSAVGAAIALQRYPMRTTQGRSAVADRSSLPLEGRAMAYASIYSSWPGLARRRRQGDPAAAEGGETTETRAQQRKHRGLRHRLRIVAGDEAIVDEVV